MSKLAGIGIALVALAAAAALMAGCKGKSLPAGREELPVSAENAAENNNPVEADKGKAPAAGKQGRGPH